MKRLLGIAAVMAVTFSRISFATEVNPTDSILIAYKLSSGQSAQFNVNDTAVSAFWGLITESNNDYWKLLPSTSTYQQNGANGFADDNDAQMTMKAAYDSNGVYLYFKVLDNYWDTDTGWQSDVIDFYIDNQTSDSINAADPTMEYVNGHLTYTCQQYWIATGGHSTPTTIGLNYYDANQSAFQNTTLDMTTSSQKIKMITVDSVTKVVEMFIPWANIGVGGVSNPSMGSHYAISGGYNDADNGTFEGVLRILHNGDPYESDQNYWANLELGPSIDQVVGIKNASSRLHSSKIASGKIIKSEYFTLEGKKISKFDNINKYNVLIRMDHLDNGKIIHSIIRK